MLFKGFNGLMAAKTYLQVFPTASVVIFDANDTLGGVWARDRLYPHLKTNNMYGTFEYPDFPTKNLDIGVKKGEYIPGQAVHRYLSLFAARHDLDRRIRFHTGVKTAECLGKDGWLLSLSATVGSPAANARVKARKLIMATGITSEPRVPHYIGQEEYKGVIFHGKDLARMDPHAFKEVCVFGGTKMGWDAAYHFAISGTKVHWVMRSSGHGPAWMGPSFVTPMKLYMEDLIMTRAFTWLSPCIWASTSGVEGLARHFLHRTWLGRKIVDGFFSAMGHEIVVAGGLNKTSETQKLIPWINPFWIGANRGIITSYDKPLPDLVSEGLVEIHIDELSHLSNDSVHLKSGKILQADALASCTGWKHKPTTRFLPEGIERQLGLPVSRSEKEASVNQQLDAEIMSTFPKLQDQPAPPSGSKTEAKTAAADDGQFRFYRFVAPPAPYMHDRTLAFCGYAQTLVTPLIATIQSLWILAYFHDRLPHLHSGSDEERQRETMLQARFGRWRYPWGFASRFPDFVFDAIPYFDMLLQDLGLDPQRKTTRQSFGWIDVVTLGVYGWMVNGFKNNFYAYQRSDYAGLVDDWMASPQAQGLGTAFRDMTEKM